MERYNRSIIIDGHGRNAESDLYDFLCRNISDDSLHSILKIDVSFIDDRAEAGDYIQLGHVSHHHANTYSLTYTLDYYVFHGCRDMNTEDDYEVTINFTVYDDHIDFDLIDHHRDTYEEF
ncbi:hypothetical protein L2164_02970 [Pectobacterium brasiliense]|uniref:hypothetical protein n=1 Tax=Pectobacterium brasiliense TaxID=180957 RepID=UPI0006998A9D|nr:hypothetical protein [Pectobacterium brasiliense]MCG5047653.1 hypothetical protein [Pectobacterium brasiliense]